MSVLKRSTKQSAAPTLAIDTIRAWSAFTSLGLRGDATADLVVADKDLAKAAPTLSRQFRRWIVAVNAPRGFRKSAASPTSSRSAKSIRSPADRRDAWTRILDFFRARPNCHTVGLWGLDVDELRNTLPAIIDRLNAVQQQFVFVSITAVPPPGLVAQPSYLRSLYGSLYPDADPLADSQVGPSMLAETFRDLAHDTLELLGIERLAGITPYGVGDYRDGELEFDNLTASQRDHILISTKYLTDTARKAHRSVALLVMWLVVGQLFVDLTDAQYHEDLGCLFDENSENFDSLVQAIRDPKVEERDLALIGTEYRSSLNAFMEAFRELSQSAATDTEKADDGQRNGDDVTSGTRSVAKPPKAATGPTRSRKSAHKNPLRGRRRRRD